MTATPRPLAEGVRKAAILMVVLGDEAASAICRTLPEPSLQKLTEEIAMLGPIEPAAAAQVLEEYHRLSLTQDILAEGGRDYANQLLVKSFGEEGARALLEQVARVNELSTAQLSSLQKADPQQLSKFLEGEHPQTIALILAHLDSRQGSALLMLLPQEEQAEVVRRLAGMRQFSPEMAQKVSVVLHSKLQSLGERGRRTYSGLKSVAELVNRLDATTSKNILESIEASDPKMALGIRNLMFTFDDLLAVGESDLRELLGQLDKKTLALALKGSSEELKSHIFKTMSSRAVEMMREDIEALGPVKGREVTKAQQEAVALARKLEADGKITLKAEREDEYVV